MEVRVGGEVMFLCVFFVCLFVFFCCCLFLFFCFFFGFCLFVFVLFYFVFVLVFLFFFFNPQMDEVFFFSFFFLVSLVRWVKFFLQKLPFATGFRGWDDFFLRCLRRLV